LPDQEAALAALKTLAQFDRILTSGARGSLLQLTRIAGPEIRIIAGGGLNRRVIQHLLDTTPVREFHIGRAARREGNIHKPVDPVQVRSLVELIASRSNV
jgi:copper homeostasis protein CutC